MPQPTHGEKQGSEEGKDVDMRCHRRSAGLYPALVNPPDAMTELASGKRRRRGGIVHVSVTAVSMQPR